MHQSTIVASLSLLCFAFSPPCHGKDTAPSLTESAAREDRKLPEVVAPSAKEIDTAMQQGVDFLLQDQNPIGSWGSATRTKGLNIYAPVPGAHDAFRTATTSALHFCVTGIRK